MFENTTFRMLMVIGAVIIVGMIITYLVEIVPEVNELFKGIRENRLQKY